MILKEKGFKLHDGIASLKKLCDMTILEIEKIPNKDLKKEIYKKIEEINHILKTQVKNT